MSIQLYVSNTLIGLAKQLSDDLRNNNLGVFTKTQIVTQTEGMNSWLKIKMAEDLGIATNCAFSKPNDIVTKLYFWLGGKSKPLLSVDYVKWNIYQLLNDTEFKQKFGLIAGYYNLNEIKQIALATKTADLFDQYQMYRPDIITEWNKADIANVGANWQQYLWIRIQAVSKNSMLDKTSMIKFIIEALQNPDKQDIVKSKLPQLQFFGIAVITPFYLQLFNELSKHIAIRFYLLNPAPTSYWLEDKSEKEIARIIQKNKTKPEAGQYSTIGNTLLSSWGTIIKDSFTLLFEDETYINNYNDDLAVIPDTPDSLLKKIQQDIFFNEPEKSRATIEEADLKDGSFTINACFTSVREVEVLYNYLVQLIDEKKEKLSARDIVVMVTDIDNYAPYIRAIFDNALYKFPYTIADESVTAGNNIFNAIEAILNVQADSFKAEEVLELLESKYIRERFGITDVGAIRNAVDAATIRFGLTGEMANETRLVSWEYGLQKIMYGICISGEPLLDLGQEILIPLDTTEGAGSVEMIKFWHFIQILQYTIEQRNQTRSIIEWVSYLQELIDNLVFESGEKEEEDYHKLISYLEKLTQLESIDDSPIGFEVFKYSFLEILAADKKTHSFAGAGITFCSLIPMRSIPFKVVAMLGLDFDKFPRKESKLSFNLLELQKRKGDRNVKDNDKHLFLETLLSAQEYFYISYIGRNVKDGAKIPPSSLVDELIGYIIQGANKTFKLSSESIITTHPLHGFSQQYFNNSGLVSYLSDDKYKTAEDSGAGDKETIIPDFSEIPIKDLQSFLKEPIKWYFNKTLGVYYKKEETLLPDTEVFELNNLSSWMLKNDLLLLPESDYEAYFDRQTKLGKLPFKNMGRIIFDDLIEEVRPKKNRLIGITQNLPAAPVEINITIDNSIISGKLQNIYGNKMVFYTDSKSYNKNVIEAFVYYIIAAAQGLVIDLHFIHFRKIDDFEIPAGYFNQQQAIAILTNWVIKFKAGYGSPLLFCSTFSENPYKIYTEPASSFEGIIIKMVTNQHDYTFDDEYLKKAYQNNYFCEANFDAFKANTLEIFDPIEQAMPGIINY